MAVVVSTELDQRMKQAVTGYKVYQIGDFAKRAILKCTGKDENKFGDITNSIGLLQKELEGKQQSIVIDDQVRTSQVL